MTNAEQATPLDRRAFLQGGALVLTATAMGATPLWADEPERLLRIGLATDLHYADKPPSGSRHYRETLVKLAEAAGRFRDESPDLVVELGDLIDSAETVEDELKHLAKVNREFSTICEDRHYVLGNHCVHTLTKEEFLDGVERERSYYSFDRRGVHFVVLDACFRGDGEPYGRKNFVWTDPNVAPSELEWLEADLASVGGPVIVFAHQRLDTADSHGIKNAAAVRRILEASGAMAAVFQGHSHHNDFRRIGDIPYCTLVAMVEGSGPESSGYSLLDVHADGTLRLEGFRRQKSYRWQ